MFVATWYKTLILLQQGSFQQMIKIVFRSNYKDKACFVLQKNIKCSKYIIRSLNKDLLSTWQPRQYVKDLLTIASNYNYSYIARNLCEIHNYSYS